jgi:hypothetical protein
MAHRLLFFSILITGIIAMHLWHKFAVYFVQNAGIGAGLVAIVTLVLLAIVLDSGT